MRSIEHAFVPCLEASSRFGGDLAKLRNRVVASCRSERAMSHTNGFIHERIRSSPMASCAHR